MKRYFFIFLGFISIFACIFGLLRYRVWTWLIFLVLGIYFLSKVRINSGNVINEKNPECEKDAITFSNAQSTSNPEKSFTFPIVGVTFKNDDGSERQKLLKKIFFKDAPFDTKQNVVLERYLWKDKPAYYVKVNNYIVGNISADFVWYFEKNSDRPFKIEYINVYGGCDGKNYGAEIHGVYLDMINQ